MPCCPSYKSPLFNLKGFLRTKEKKLQHMKYKEHLNTSFQCLVSCLHANIKYILSCVEPQTRRVATIFQTESMSSEHCLAIGLSFHINLRISY